MNKIFLFAIGAIVLSSKLYAQEVLRAELIAQMPVVSLPLAIKEKNFFKESYLPFEHESIHEENLKKKPELIPKLDALFSDEELPAVASPYIEEYVGIKSWQFLYRLPPMEHIEWLVYGGSGSDPYLWEWVLLSYDTDQDQIISKQTLFVVKNYSSEYSYDYALYIDKAYQLVSLQSKAYESASEVLRKFQYLTADGKIVLEDQESFSCASTSPIDYKRHFKPVPEVPVLTETERKKAYSIFLEAIPEVSLPYLSDSFEDVMSIQNHQNHQETSLHYSRLTEVAYSDVFLGNEAPYTFNEVDEIGHKAFPICRFPRNENVTIVAFVYATYANLTPKIYLQLNSYNKDGVLLDEWIADKRFFTSYDRLLSSFEWKTDFHVRVKRYHWDYSYYVEGEGIAEEIKLSTQKENYFISEEGIFLFSGKDSKSE